MRSTTLWSRWFSLTDREINNLVVDLVFDCYVYKTTLCGGDFDDEPYDVEFEVPRSVKNPLEWIRTELNYIPNNSNYADDFYSAFCVVDEMRKYGWTRFTLCQNDDGTWTAEFKRRAGRRVVAFDSTDKKPTRAICLAAISARKYDKQNVRS